MLTPPSGDVAQPVSSVVGLYALTLLADAGVDADLSEVTERAPSSAGSEGADEDLRSVAAVAPEPASPGPAAALDQSPSASTLRGVLLTAGGGAPATRSPSPMREAEGKIHRVDPKLTQQFD